MQVEIKVSSKFKKNAFRKHQSYFQSKMDKLQGYEA